MPLLKATEYRSESLKVETFNLNDIAAEAEAMLESARREAKNMIEHSRTLIEANRQVAQAQGHDEGYAKGFEAGQKKGHEQALAEAKQKYEQQSRVTMDSLKALMSQFDQCKDQLLWQGERHTVELAQAIAEKVTRQLGCLKPEVTAENIKAALGLVTKRTSVVVRINPTVIEHIERMQAGGGLISGEWKSIRFEKDDTIKPGGCVVQTEQGCVDSQLETQLQRIAEAMLIGTSNMKESSTITE